MSDLARKKCVPCEGGVRPLAAEDAERLLPQVPGWSLVGGSPPRIVRELRFRDFREALAFVNRVGELAEGDGHHPDILIHSWNRVRLELSTHAIRGLHENDFILAAKVNGLEGAGAV